MWRSGGLGVQEATEALAHWRGLVEETATVGVAHPVVIADLDVRNFFNNVELPATRRGEQRFLLEASAAVGWEQRVLGAKVLADGADFQLNRGSEQGEALGVCGGHWAAGNGPARRRLQLQDWDWLTGSRTSGSSTTGWSSATRSSSTAASAPWTSRSRRSVQVGGRGDEDKSTAKLVGPPRCKVALAGWDTPYVRAMCRVIPVIPPDEHLGAVVGATGTPGASQEDGASLQSVMRKTEAKRSAINALEFFASDIALLRTCAGVSAMSYWLRCHGDRLQAQTLQKHDQTLRATIECALGGELPDIG